METKYCYLFLKAIVLINNSGFPAGLEFVLSYLLMPHNTKLQRQGQQREAVPSGYSPSHPCALQARRISPASLGRRALWHGRGEISCNSCASRGARCRLSLQHKADLSGPFSALTCAVFLCLLLACIYLQPTAPKIPADLLALGV